MLLSEILNIIPEGQWVIVSVLSNSETYGFYYRKGMEQIPDEYYNSIVYLVKASKNNTLEVLI